MKKIYLIVGAMLWGGIVDAQTLSVEQYGKRCWNIIRISKSPNRL